MKFTTSFICAITLFSSHVCAEKPLADASELYEGKEFKKAFANPKDDSALPRVLLIGDSISIGYTVPVRKRMVGKANIHRIPGNGQTAGYGVQKLDKWLGDKPWDVIHFNWGLWDLCYRHPESKNQGHRDKVNGEVSTTTDEYRAQLEKAVAILKKTNATLVWCATTPVPDKETGRIKGDELIYNKIAEEIMTKHGIMINKLHAHALKEIPEIYIKPGNVHFNAKGNEHLADQVAKSLLEAINKKKTKN